MNTEVRWIDCWLLCHHLIVLIWNRGLLLLQVVPCAAFPDVPALEVPLLQSPKNHRQLLVIFMLTTLSPAWILRTSLIELPRRCSGRNLCAEWEWLWRTSLRNQPPLTTHSRRDHWAPDSGVNMLYVVIRVVRNDASLVSCAKPFAQLRPLRLRRKSELMAVDERHATTSTWPNASTADFVKWV